MNPSIVHRASIIAGCIVAGALLSAALIKRPPASHSPLPAGRQGAAASLRAGGGQSPPARRAADWVARGDRIMQQARTTQADSDYRRAEAAYRQALAIQPARAAAMTGLAWVHGARHEFEASIRWARRAVRMAPDLSEAYGIWGDALVEMGDYDEAFTQYQRMMDLRPDLAAYSRSAHLLFLTGAAEDALMLMRKAIAAGGPYAENLAWCRAKLAHMLNQLGNYGRARALLTAALEQTPDNFHLLAAMAQVQTSLKNYPAAIDCYEKALVRIPHPAHIAALGDLYQLTGRRREAERRFALAEAIWRLRAAGGGQIDIHRARFYADHDRHLGQALAEAETIYRTRRNVAAADTLAWCYYKNGRPGKARTMIRQALRLGTPDARMLYHAGMIHCRLGRRSQARRYLQAALALSPNFDPRFAARAARTLRQLNKKGEPNDHKSQS